MFLGVDTFSHAPPALRRAPAFCRPRVSPLASRQWHPLLNTKASPSPAAPPAPPAPTTRRGLSRRGRARSPARVTQRAELEALTQRALTPTGVRVVISDDAHGHHTPYPQFRNAIDLILARRHQQCQAQYCSCECHVRRVRYIPAGKFAMAPLTGRLEVNSFHCGEAKLIVGCNSSGASHHLRRDLVPSPSRLRSGRLRTKLEDCEERELVEEIRLSLAEPRRQSSPTESKGRVPPPPAAPVENAAFSMRRSRPSRTSLCSCRSSTSLRPAQPLPLATQ
ncbi:hypothetical protein DFH08DRAFT_859711 [Mycena albidolilacea]|uniref:Uncharacterized protein n=1 Tax=Mycena albidolilacea TaxID=1033008 RepID=A0AAD7EUK3_9AGAR|nr:hypothetical protein DFH08DRAFT_859711 [Mycena albidolilacea]